MNFEVQHWVKKLECLKSHCLLDQLQLIHVVLVVWRLQVRALSRAVNFEVLHPEWKLKSTLKIVPYVKETGGVLRLVETVECLTMQGVKVWILCSTKTWNSKHCSGGGWGRASPPHKIRRITCSFTLLNCITSSLVLSSNPQVKFVNYFRWCFSPFDFFCIFPSIKFWYLNWTAYAKQSLIESNGEVWVIWSKEM